MWRLLHMVQEVHLHIHKDVYYAVTTPTNSNICMHTGFLPHADGFFTHSRLGDWRAILPVILTSTLHTGATSCAVYCLLRCRCTYRI